MRIAINISNQMPWVELIHAVHLYGIATYAHNTT